MILTEITIYQCDNCPAIVTVRDEADRRVFNVTWFDGLIYQFCPDCRTTDAVKPKLEKEAAALESLKNFDTEGGTLDAEIIN